MKSNIIQSALIMELAGANRRLELLKKAVAEAETDIRRIVSQISIPDESTLPADK